MHKKPVPITAIVVFQELERALVRYFHRRLKCEGAWEDLELDVTNSQDKEKEQAAAHSGVDSAEDEHHHDPRPKNVCALYLAVILLITFFLGFSGCCNVSISQ